MDHLDNISTDELEKEAKRVMKLIEQMQDTFNEKEDKTIGDSLTKIAIMAGLQGIYYKGYDAGYVKGVNENKFSK